MPYQIPHSKEVYAAIQAKLDFKSTNPVEIVDAINRALEGPQTPLDRPTMSGDGRAPNQGR